MQALCSPDSLSPSISDGSIFEPAAALVRPERKLFATSSETSETSETRRSRERKDLAESEGSRRDPRGSEAAESAWQSAGLAAP